MKSLENKVFWVGVGPGDPELISLKGVRVIQHAEVILYDDWISPTLLDYASDTCKLVPVAKSTVCHRASNDISSTIVKYANRCNRLVRLTGGDPNVFGRAHEELQYVRVHGFDVEVISGISSTTAAPCAAGIPLTVRGINESFCVMTDPFHSGYLSEDFRWALCSSATIVILMGISSLKEIANCISQHRGDDEPVAVIEQATTEHQQVVKGVANNIYSRMHAAAIRTPAIIIVGKVVGLSGLENCIPAGHPAHISEHSLALPTKS